MEQNTQDNYVQLLLLLLQLGNCTHRKKTVQICRTHFLLVAHEKVTKGCCSPWCVVENKDKTTRKAIFLD